MKKQTTTGKATSRKAANTVSSPMSGADIVVKCLENEGVEVIFAYPGGASLELHQSLTRSKKIRVILPRHEQGGVFAAAGYARATGRAGVVMATSGPGATNLVTGIADCFMDSVPLVAITGQVSTHMIGRGAFQETDVFGMTVPICKHSYLVTDINDLPRIFKEAFHIAETGRPGPVVIDIPKNVQQQKTQPHFVESFTLRGYQPAPKPEQAALNDIVGLISNSERPMLYIGGGIITANATFELKKFVELTQIPVATTLMGIGAFPESDPLCLRWLGMHGTVAANNAVNEADLLLAFGVRFDDRVTGKVEKFAEHGTIVHIDIDDSELNKNKPAQLPIRCDIKEALRGLNDLLSHGRLPKDHHAKWLQTVATWKKAHPFKFDDAASGIQPQYAIRRLWEMTRGEAIITTGVGQHQMWAGQFYEFAKPRTFLTSAGLGSMGFGFPAAMGAKVACPHKQVVDIDGDGSFVMNIQELACAHIEGIAVKAMVLNNQHLGMVVQWEDRFYSSNRGNTFLGDPRDQARIYPDFVTICQGFGVKAERVTSKKELDGAIRRMLESKDCYVLDVMVPYTEHVLPMIPSGHTYRDIITEPDGSGPHKTTQKLKPGSGL